MDRGERSKGGWCPGRVAFARRGADDLGRQRGVRHSSEEVDRRMDVVGWAVAIDIRLGSADEARLDLLGCRGRMLMMRVVTRELRVLDVGFGNRVRYFPRVGRGRLRMSFRVNMGPGKKQCRDANECDESLIDSEPIHGAFLCS